MYALEVIKEVERVLALDGMTQRRAAKITGVSRGTVSSISRGEHGSYHREVLPKLLYPSGRLSRCSTCGAMVALPCHVCRVRGLINDGMVKPEPHQTTPSLGLDLYGENLRRYEEIKKNKQPTLRGGIPWSLV
jgi:DNA-binding XRE family transcriptional regulator